MPQPTQKCFVTGSEFPALEPGKLRLYSMRWCPYAQRARIVLEHKGITYETVNIHLKQKPEWFLKLNPLGTVPALQKDDITVYESLVICEYLDEVYPGEKIVPSDSYQKAKDRMFYERYSKIVTKLYGVLRSGEPAQIQENAKNLMSEFSLLEDELKTRKTKFYGGDKPMLIDFAMWPHMERLVAMGKMIPPLAITKETFPLFTSWVDDMLKVPAVKATSEPSDQHIAFFKTFKSGNPNYDQGLEE